MIQIQVFQSSGVLHHDGTLSFGIYPLRGGEDRARNSEAASLPVGGQAGVQVEAPDQSFGLVRSDDAEAVELLEAVKIENRSVLEDAHKISAHGPPPRALDGA